jgi:hypothetical protein
VLVIAARGALGSLALDQVSVSTVLEVSAAACTLTGVAALLVPAIRTSSLRRPGPDPAPRLAPDSLARV